MNSPHFNKTDADYSLSMAAFATCFPSSSRNQQRLDGLFPAQLRTSAQIVDQILKSDHSSCSDAPNASNEAPTHRVDHESEDMLHTSPHPRLQAVLFLLCFRQRMIPIPLFMNAIADLTTLQFRTDLLRSIGAISVQFMVRILLLQQITQCLRIMHAGIAGCVCRDQLALPIHLHVILVSKMPLAVLLRPAGIRILLSTLCRFILPFFRDITVADRVVLVPAVSLPGNLDKGCVHDRSLVRDQALTTQMSVKPLEQLVHSPSAGQRLTEQPDRLLVRDTILQGQAQKPHKRQPVLDRELRSFVGYIIEMLI